MSDLSLAVRPQGDESRAGMAQIEELEAWPLLSGLPVMLMVHIGLTRLRVSDLLALKAGQVLTSEWSELRDVPLSVGQVRLGWSEFEVSGQRLSVRLTQLA
jgi:flagellar motor switch protein FliM